MDDHPFRVVITGCETLLEQLLEPFRNPFGGPAEVLHDIPVWQSEAPDLIGMGTGQQVERKHAPVVAQPRRVGARPE
ncbi:hypothetical protein D3C81_1477550 [compost metagenome]